MIIRVNALAQNWARAYFLGSKCKFKNFILFPFVAKLFKKTKKLILSHPFNKGDWKKNGSSDTIYCFKRYFFGQKSCIDARNVI